MRVTTKSLLNNARRFHDIVKDDQKVCFLLFCYLNSFFLFRNLLNQKI
jgi:hypothetical protein